MPAAPVPTSGSIAENSPAGKRGYNFLLLMVAGFGGLLYGVDVGIIAGALPYLQATSKFNAGQLSIVVAAVLLGASVLSVFYPAWNPWRAPWALQLMEFLGWVKY